MNLKYEKGGEALLDGPVWGGGSELV